MSTYYSGINQTVEKFSLIPFYKTQVIIHLLTKKINTIVIVKLETYDFKQLKLKRANQKKTLN